MDSFDLGRATPHIIMMQENGMQCSDRALGYQTSRTTRTVLFARCTAGLLRLRRCTRAAETDLPAIQLAWTVFN